MNRKQMAYRVIASVADELVFSIDCGDSTLVNKNKDELVDIVYHRLINNTVSSKHFKFLTKEWIEQSIEKELDKAMRKWGVIV